MKTMYYYDGFGIRKVFIHEETPNNYIFGDSETSIAGAASKEKFAEMTPETDQVYRSFCAAEEMRLKYSEIKIKYVKEFITNHLK